MEIAVCFKASKNFNSLQVFDITIPETYFSILELKEEAYNPTKSGRYESRGDFVFEGIGHALVFNSAEIQPQNNHTNMFRIETFRNSTNDNFNVSIKPETQFYTIEADNGVHAFICALQILFNSSSRDMLSNVFKPSWDGTILKSVHEFIFQSFKPLSELVEYSSK